MPNALPTSSDAIPTTTDHTTEVAKNIVSVHRHIFNAFISNFEHPTVVSIQLIRPIPSAPHFTVYEMTIDKENYGCGADAFPPGTPIRIIRGFMKYNWCVFAMLTFLDSLRRTLANAVPGTIVEWLRIKVKNEAPLIKFLKSDAPFDPVHEAFLITLPSLPGEEPKRFVADFTIEQYGGEEWWVEFADYLQGMTSDGKSFKMIENQSEASLGCSQSFRWEAARLRDLCAALDWSVLSRVEDESKGVSDWSVLGRTEDEKKGPFYTRWLRRVCPRGSGRAA